MDPLVDSDIPSRIGPYALREQLGRGPHCTVWRAEREPTGEVLALKVLDPRCAEDESRSRRFVEEARLARSLEHPNIVRVVDIVEPGDAELPCFAMELLNGGTVAGFREAPFEDFPRIVALFADVCSALQYIHDRGLVHCDVKTSNVLLDDEGRPHLTDFGMTATPEEIELAGSRGGTIAYMSPEQFVRTTDPSSTSHHVDGRSDVYSLGVLMYHVLTGRPPFTGSNRFSLMFQRVRSRPPAPSEIREGFPEPLADVLMRSLEREPENRFPTAERMREALLAAALPES